MRNLFLRNILILLIAIPGFAYAQQRLPVPGVDARLYLGKTAQQPLLVGLGGSEGGNAWDSDYWKATRDSFLSKGYAFLALGYFGGMGTPDTLNRIAIDKVHDAIVEAASHSLVNKDKIAIIGGSRGGDLALLLGSYYKDIRCVVAIVPSHVAFPGHTNHFTTSAWTYRGKELPFVPVSEAAVPFLKARNLLGTFEAMLLDTAAERQAMIKVEQINGPVLLLSATQDAVCPSTPMSEKMAARLKAMRFPYPYRHVVIEGGHTAPLQRFDLVYAFLDQYFK